MLMTIKFVKCIVRQSNGPLKSHLFNWSVNQKILTLIDMY